MRSTRRRRLSMTSLVDVIFLLLLFFMLSSTFTRFAEVELAAAQGGTGEPATRPYFIRLSADASSLNGEDMRLDALPGRVRSLTEGGDEPVPVLVSPAEGVTAQRLMDLLVTLRSVEGVRTTVLGAS